MKREGETQRIYRAMQIDDRDGWPMVGESKRRLGAKPGIGFGTDIPVDADGYVYPSSGGMSVAPRDAMIHRTGAPHAVHGVPGRTCRDQAALDTGDMIETEENRGMTVEELRATNLHGAALGQYLFDRIGELLAQGVSVDSIRAWLIGYYDRLGDDGLDADQDAIADVMDSLLGNCPPTARLRA